MRRTALRLSFIGGKRTFSILRSHGQLRCHSKCAGSGPLVAYKTHLRLSGHNVLPLLNHPPAQTLLESARLMIFADCKQMD